MRKTLLSLLVVIVLFIASPAQKGTSVVRRVNFPHARTTAVLQGTINRDLSHDYLLKARGGQTMIVHLASSGDCGFEVLSPTGESISNDARDWTGSLSRSGDYRINVLPPSQTDEPARYSLEVTIR
jgi:hypothetical protein